MTGRIENKNPFQPNFTITSDMLQASSLIIQKQDMKEDNKSIYSFKTFDILETHMMVFDR